MANMYILYGDGIHDDTNAIQEMIDQAVEVVLPAPKVHYLISRPLEVPSNFRLVLPRYAEIRLAKGSNCYMLKNKTVTDRQERTKEKLFDFLNEYSPDAPCHNIEIVGGIWNFNNMEQNPNPLRAGFTPAGYTGIGFLFYNVKNLRISSLTLKNPTNFAVTLDTVSYFTIDHIIFDFNLGNPCAINMDGIHLNGNCHFGVIKDLKGACYDDLVALNAHEGSKGPITNIQIDGLHAEVCHSAVRMLTVSDIVENIHISNVYGTYYQYCIGITKYYKGETTGYFDGITLDNIYASKASRDGIYPWPKTYVFPLIYMQEEIYAKNVKISEVHRKEYCIPVETIFVGENAVVEKMIVDHVVTENHTGETMPVIVKKGEVQELTVQNIRSNGDPVIVE